MGFLDKLPFAKKKDDFSADAFKDPFSQQQYGNQTFSTPQDPVLIQPSQNYGSPPSYPVQPYPPQGSPLYPQQGMEQFSSSNINKDIELLRAKIDTVQATLESLNQRFAAIERYINESAKRKW